MDRAAALRAYAEVSLLARRPRELEAEAFGKAIRLLEDGRRALPDFKRYADAVRFNQSLWTIVQGDLLAPDNPLPAELRDNLLQLSLFVDRRTLTALGDPNGEHLQVLIDINRQLQQGLQETPPL
jgi:flagellar protein FlaF